MSNPKILLDRCVMHMFMHSGQTSPPELTKIGEIDHAISLQFKMLLSWKTFLNTCVSQLNCSGLTSGMLVASPGKSGRTAKCMNWCERCWTTVRACIILGGKEPDAPSGGRSVRSTNALPTYCFNAFFYSACCILHPLFVPASFIFTFSGHGNTGRVPEDMSEPE